MAIINADWELEPLEGEWDIDAELVLFPRLQMQTSSRVREFVQLAALVCP